MMLHVKMKKEQPQKPFLNHSVNIFSDRSEVQNINSCDIILKTLEFRLRLVIEIADIRQKTVLHKRNSIEMIYFIKYEWNERHSVRRVDDASRENEERSCQNEIR